MSNEYKIELTRFTSDEEFHWVECELLLGEDLVGHGETLGAKVFYRPRFGGPWREFASGMITDEVLTEALDDIWGSASRPETVPRHWFSVGETDVVEDQSEEIREPPGQAKEAVRRVGVGPAPSIEVLPVDVQGRRAPDVEGDREGNQEIGEGPRWRQRR